MNQGFLITGTDTGVGKTFVTSLMAMVLTDAGINTGVMKPVETGCAVKNGRLIPIDAMTLKNASGAEDPLDAINPFRFAPALAPNIAARLENVKIDLRKIKDCFKSLSKAHDLILVEGAGGLLSPLTDEKTMADLAVALKLSIIIVAPSRIGVINHALLTVECARRRNLHIDGIILNNPTPPERDASRAFNRAEIERLSGIPVLGEIPFLKPLQ